MSSKQYDVFLSHHSADKPAVEFLAQKLHAKGVKLFLDKWNLVPGTPWQEALENALDASMTCAVFLGPHGPGTWENEEMRVALDQRARSRMFRVIPVLLPETSMPDRADQPAFLNRLTWVDFRSGLDDAEAFRRLLCGIRGEEPGPPRPKTKPSSVTEARPPYKGIEPFGVDDTDLFHGREALTQYLVEYLRRHRFFAVTGPSGSGKSSLMRAGLIPALRQGALPGSAEWALALFKPGRTPLRELAVRLLPYLANPELSFSEQIERLSTAMSTDGWALTTALRSASPAQLLLVVDQCEEIFTQTPSETERQAFFSNLLNASSPTSGKVSVVLVLRADFYVRVAAYSNLADRIAARQVIVTAMQESDLWQAITGPATQSGLHFEAGLVEEILEEMRGQAGALPLLQQALLELWKQREGTILTIAAYKAIGGVKRAIARWAESVYESLSTTQQVLARRIFVELVQPGDKDTRRRVLLRELSLDPDHAFEIEDVLERLIQDRLLTTDRDALTSEKLVEIAHEALLQEWPRLREWLEKSRVSRLIRTQLQERVKNWEKYGRDQGSLLRGAELTEIELWSQEHPEDVKPLDREYLKASIDARKSEGEQKELLQRLLTRQESPLDALDLRAEIVQGVQSVASPTRRTSDTLEFPETAILPDIQLFVRLSSIQGRSRLNFEIRAQSLTLEPHFQEFGSISLEMESRDFALDLIRDLENLSDDSAEIVQTRLASIGTFLFRSLPEELQSILWNLQGQANDVQILSDEPYIPWEVLKLGQRKLTGWQEGPFLCEAFGVTRWIRTIPQHILPLPLGKLALISPRDSGLPAAQLEMEELLAIFGQTGRVSIIEPTLIKVLDALRHGDFDCWHFIGHGHTFSKGDANRAKIFLEDHQELRPTDLIRAGENLSRSRPLVFLNASGSGQGGFSLTGPGGWALQFLEAGASAFIGSLWGVRDSTARTFARSFYSNLFQGYSFGEAARKARQQLREEFPGDPAWLAYTVYAHPKVIFSPTSYRPKQALLELRELEWDPQTSPPDGLLRAEARVVPFHGREKEISDLCSWCLDSSPVRVRLYTGPGGMGKTRLALEAALKMREEGWWSGFVTSEAIQSPEKTWKALARPEGKLLLIVDYAETNRPFLIPVLRELYRHERGPVRLILLARAALDWWEQLKSERDGVGELLSGPATARYSLQPLADSVEARASSYGIAAQAFSKYLQTPPAEVPDDLKADYFQRVLLLHMKALIDMEGKEKTKGEDHILDRILDRERSFWATRTSDHGISPEIAPGIGRALAVITLAGGVAKEADAVAALRGLKFFADQPAAVLTAVARLLHESYPGERWIEPLQPDLLGEHLVQRELEKGADELLDLVLRPRSEG